MSSFVLFSILRNLFYLIVLPQTVFSEYTHKPPKTKNVCKKPPFKRKAV